ncbi:hypothetical protein ACPPVO_29460 [Dactylosporangium sp. McL0621]|uniref:hypothetical protein n=1 Tax=Dactylosporangium sp. McL0621 TaxID=3415678 RepID=UPI003CF2C182
MLSKLTPGDRAAIAGATGYHLSQTGAVTNASDAVPPWSFILAFAASRSAVEPAAPSDDAKGAAAAAPAASTDDGHHVDVTV